MSILMTRPAVADLPRIAAELGSWQNEGETLQLHPGDLGWHSLVGAARTAEDLRVWSRNGKMVALGLLDEPSVLRMAMDPAVRDDAELARQIGSDVSNPDAGVLAAGEAVIEARGARSLRKVLSDEGWTAGETWTPFCCDLLGPLPTDRMARAEICVESAGPDQAEDWLSVHWSAFKGAPFGDADKARLLDRWAAAMAGGPFAPLAGHLIARDRRGNAVAVTSVWGIGVGRPGLIEPMGVHRDHRGHGYGVAITVAGAVALREMGSSSAVVAAEDSNLGALATYAAAGFTARQPVADLKRSA